VQIVLLIFKSLVRHFNLKKLWSNYQHVCNSRWKFYLRFKFQTNSTTGSDGLMFANIWILDSEKCKNYKENFLNEKMICAGVNEVMTNVLILICIPPFLSPIMLKFFPRNSICLFDIMDFLTLEFYFESARWQFSLYREVSTVARVTVEVPWPAVVSYAESLASASAVLILTILEFTQEQKNIGNGFWIMQKQDSSSIIRHLLTILKRYTAF
jgi:hypothetical protein